MKTVQALNKVASLQFRPFTKTDWDCFGGCESKEPLIAEDGDCVWIVDGNRLARVKEDGSELCFTLAGTRGLFKLAPTVEA